MTRFTVAHCQASALGKHQLLMSRASSFIIVTPAQNFYGTAEHLKKLSTLGKPHRINISVHLGIAQIAIGPPTLKRALWGT